jgi:hypothetical protein
MSTDRKPPEVSNYSNRDDDVRCNLEYEILLIWRHCIFPFSLDAWPLPSVRIERKLSEQKE